MPVPDGADQLERGFALGLCVTFDHNVKDKAVPLLLIRHKGQPSIAGSRLFVRRRLAQGSLLNCVAYEICFVFPHSAQMARSHPGGIAARSASNRNLPSNSKINVMGLITPNFLPQRHRTSLALRGSLPMRDPPKDEVERSQQSQRGRFSLGSFWAFVGMSNFGGGNRGCLARISLLAYHAVPSFLGSPLLLSREGASRVLEMV